MQNAKNAARQIIDHLPDQATWDDIMYELYVKQKIEEGLADIEAGRTVPHEQVKAELPDHLSDPTRARLCRDHYPWQSQSGRGRGEALGGDLNLFGAIREAIEPYPDWFPFFCTNFSKSIHLIPQGRICIRL